MSRIKLYENFESGGLDLKPINSFEARSGIKPKFDQGDLITNGVDNYLVSNITSASDGKAYYILIKPDELRTSISGEYEYQKVSKEWNLIKKGDRKLQTFLSSDPYDPDKWAIASGLKPYPTWFEKRYKG
jgi:hypothetical protein